MVKAKEGVLKDPILQKIVDVIVKELDPDKIILFGSRARGDHDEYSDYDILVLKEGIRPEERRKVAVFIFRKLIERLKFVPADIIVQDTETFKRLKNYRFMIYRSVEREGITLYEKRGKKVA